MKWHLTKDKLPEEKRLVIVYIPNRPWFWNGKGDIHYKIAWLVKENRKGDSYYWEEIGPDRFDAEEVKAWTYFEVCDLLNKERGTRK